LKATNVAVSGSISREHLERQIARLGRADSNTLGLIVITTGGNDIIHSYGRMPPQEGAMFGATMEQARPWIDNFEKRLETMIVTVHRVGGTERKKICIESKIKLMSPRSSR